MLDGYGDEPNAGDSTWLLEADDGTAEDDGELFSTHAIKKVAKTTDVRVDPKNPKLLRCCFTTSRNVLVTNDLYYPYASATQADSLYQGAEFVNEQQFEEIDNFLLKINSNNIKQAHNRLILRSLLTQAILSKSHNRGEAAFNACIQNILLTCFAAGYNILAEPSLLAKTIKPAGTLSSAKVEYYSFLELAYHYGDTFAIQTFYELGHELLTEAQLSSIIKPEAVNIAELIELAIYYQHHSSSKLQEYVLQAIFDPKNNNFSNNEQRVSAARTLLLFGSQFTHGVLNGGTKRIRKLYQDLYGESVEEKEDSATTESNAATAVSVSASQFHPGALVDDDFRRLFQAYALRQQHALQTIEKHRVFRQKELTVPVKIIQHIVSNPGKPIKEKKEKDSDPLTGRLATDEYYGYPGYPEYPYDTCTAEPAAAATASSEADLALKKAMLLAKTKANAALVIATELNSYQDEELKHIIAETKYQEIALQCFVPNYTVTQQSQISILQALNLQRNPHSIKMEQQKKGNIVVLSDKIEAEQESDQHVAKTASAKLLWNDMPWAKPSRSSLLSLPQCKMPFIKTSVCGVTPQPTGTGTETGTKKQEQQDSQHVADADRAGDYNPSTHSLLPEL